MSSQDGEERFSDSLQEVADLLRDQRPALEPLELDRIKLRAMSRAPRSRAAGRRAFVRSPLTSLLTLVFLIVGTGGALALGGGSVGLGNLGLGSDHGGSAGFGQYRCPPGQKFYFGKCRPVPPPHCPPGFVFKDGGCVPVPPPPPKCRPPFEFSNGKCVPPPPRPRCRFPFVYLLGKCVLLRPPHHGPPGGPPGVVHQSKPAA